MSHRLQNAAQSQEVSPLDRGGRRMLKAAAPSPAESHTVPDAPIAGFGGCVEAVLVRVFGSKKAAAIELQTDRSQLRRQCERGTLMLREIDRPDILAELGYELVAQYGGARKSRKQVAIERIPELIALMIGALEEDR
jgi:hypothetical protein